MSVVQYVNVVGDFNIKTGKGNLSVSFLNCKVFDKTFIFFVL